MNESQSQFDQRLRRLDHKHKAMARGRESVMRPDGLIMTAPLAARSRGPIRPVVILIVALFLFKAILIVNVGEATYKQRVLELRHGNLIEHAGAVVMQLDPISDFIALQLRPYLR
ncbi:hypothetical protein [Sedimentitalea todarodis]|uniref:Uncharacterized protein n=1 Tax=Sedimentitalea todarodis TaxID=1631240 RepID=A0ABU3V8E8_9RHOB|nr:hypothetical protein [Sedimentitalea todarodis]MDU9002442.1 hypothetical protein [Sedimentitalea todarodis]